MRSLTGALISAFSFLMLGALAPLSCYFPDGARADALRGTNLIFPDLAGDDRFVRDFAYPFRGRRNSIPRIRPTEDNNYVMSIMI